MSRSKLGQVVKLVAATAAPQRSDRDLLEAFVEAQDQTAFALLVQRYGPLVLGVSRRVLRDQQDAEDACQATFLILARKAATVRWHDTVRGWLYRVAYRVAREARSRRARRLRHELAAAGTVPQASDAGPSWAEVASVLDDELNRLPAKYRDVLVLCYLEGKSRDEAAEQLGWGLGAVKKRLEKARERLRGRLSRRGLTLSAALFASLLDQQAAPAAMPALTMTQVLRATAGPSSAIPPTVLSLAQGVMQAMFLTKLKIAAVGLLLVALLGTGLAFMLSGSAAALAPADVDRPTGKVKPGQVAVSQPDKNGLVTMFRPLVTQLAPGDPVRVGLHWATPNGPIPNTFDDKTLAGSRVLRDATLNSMTFTIDTPQGKRLNLQPKVELPAGVTHPPMSLYQAATILLTLTDNGFEEAGLCKGPWADGRKAAFAAPGVYTIQVSGNIVRDKAEPIPFTSGTISLELGVAGLKPLSQVEAGAQKTLEANHKLNPGKTAVVEDETGNRILRFTGPDPAVNPIMPWTQVNFKVLVKPDGTTADTSQKTVGTCIARGTPIDTPDGPVAVENVREGDQVWSFELGQRVPTTVRLIRRDVAQETLLFGRTLRVTAEHPVHAGGDWKQARSIVPEDLLLTADLKAVAAGTPRLLTERIEIFDLTVDEPHNYFAGGFLVHNKSRLWTPSMDDVWYQLWPLPEAKK